MERVRPNLWQSDAEHLFGRAKTRAYLLGTGGRHVLVYNTRQAAFLDQAEALGGISHQLISHRHEAAQNLATIRQRFGASLVADAEEAPYVSRFTKVDVVVGGSTQVGSVLALPTPGHTAGGLSFLHESEHGRYLFTGDLLYVDRGTLSTLVFEGDGGDSTTLARTLEGLKALEPDMIFSSAFVGDRSSMDVGAVWNAEIDRNLRRLRGR